MGDWIEDEIVAKKFEGEDINDEDVASDWEVDSEEEKAEAEEQRRKEEELAKMAARQKQLEEEKKRLQVEKLKNEDPNQRKARIKKEMEASNMSIVDDLFGASEGGSGQGNAIVEAEVDAFYGGGDDEDMIAAVSKSKGIQDYTLNTPQDYEGLAKDLSDRLKMVKNRKGKVMVTDFLKKLNKTVIENLEVEQIKEISQAMTVVLNRKAKEKQPKKKNTTKKNVRVGGGEYDAFDDLF